jgi:hypothetical protein
MALIFLYSFFDKKKHRINTMSYSIDTLSVQNPPDSSVVAHSLTSAQRQEIGIQAIGGTPISHVAEYHSVSRKFVYQQKEKVLGGIAQAFENQAEGDDDVLFYIPVTKKWLCQVVFALIFICRASYQGVVEFFRDILDYEISKGTIGNIVQRRFATVKEINQRQDLSSITSGLHDEIYQAGDPVLVGCCAHSTFCYLLKLEDSCDANSWGISLLDLKECQGLAPDFTVIDGGPSARAGQKDAWPDIPAHGDVFHAFKPFLAMVKYLENRAVANLQAVEDLKRKIEYPRGKWKEHGQQQELIQKLIVVEATSQRSVSLVDDLTILYRWLKNDVLSLVGPLYEDRRELLRFIVEELRIRESQCSHKIEPVRKYLENHSDNLLEFVPWMEVEFESIAQAVEVPVSDVWAIYQLKGLSSSSAKHWELEGVLRGRLRNKFHQLTLLINEVLKNTVRANSLIENINSRLRTYFTLRRELGNEYLSFLQFFLNHRRFMRSRYEGRVGKSPAELLTGKNHQHWLEMLGFKLFKQAA